MSFNLDTSVPEVAEEIARLKRAVKARSFDEDLDRLLSDLSRLIFNQGGWPEPYAVAFRLVVDTYYERGALAPLADFYACQFEPARDRLRRFDQEHYVVQAGMAGHGLIFVSMLLVQDHLREGWLRPFRPAVRLPGLRYCAVCTKERAETRKVRRFVQWLEAEADAGHAGE